MEKSNVHGSWLIPVVLGLLFYMVYLSWSQRARFRKGTKYCYGVITGFSKGERSADYVDFKFWVKDMEYQGATSGCNCNTVGHRSCSIGDTVYVAYAIVDPKTNTLLFTLPAGKNFDSVYH